ncbi:MAG: bifunctional oligoribonuclease/PAP phosphatase NrnA [Bacteroidales bacterium]|nr:bifunctional oligoribonuclease/PAP phosphatase NrnA [Bacteroidales bacterium]
MNNVKAFDRLAGDSSSITITVHIHPDGDAVGSGTALMSYLTECRGKDAVLVVPGIIPESLAFITEGVPEWRVIEYGKDPEAACRRIRESDLLVCLDCNSYSRTVPGMESLLRASVAPKILIDHHLNPETEAFSLVFSETEISSTCELLYNILKSMPDVEGKTGNLPMTSLTALMAGMTTDTNNFANSVWPGTLEMASDLLAAGVDRDGILYELYDSYRENRLRLMAYLVGDKMKITPEGAAYMILDKETQDRFGFLEGESEGFVNIPLSVKAVRMSIFLTAEEDRFRVSIRSKRGISANRFAMEYFNGGGHEMAAGGKLPYKEGMLSAEDAEAYILKVSALFLKK